MATKRDPAVAGFFYPDSEKELINTVDSCLGEAQVPALNACVAVSPHAGYIYSGKVAGEVIGGVDVPNRVVILGPKHRHAGAKAAVSAMSSWVFPFGEVPIDKVLADAVVKETEVVFDDAAHREEHSLEVQVPFLWRRNPNLMLTPIALGMQRIEALETLGLGLARAIQKGGEPVLIVASTDMSHQISQDQAERLDNMAIQHILELDPPGLYKTVTDNNISMCGVVPTTAALYAAKALGATEAKLVRYATSGDVTGDFAHVVGYAGVVVK